MAGQDLPNQNNLSEFTIWMTVFVSVLILVSIHAVLITFLIIKLMRDKQRLENNKMELGEDDDDEGGIITGSPINESPSGLRKRNVQLLDAEMRTSVGVSEATVDLPVATVDLPVATVDLPVDTIDLPAATIDLPVDTISQTFADTRLKPKATADIDIPKDLSFKHPAKTFSHDYHMIKYHNIAIFSMSYKPPSVIEDDQEEFQPIHHFPDELVLPQPEEEEVVVEDVFTDYGLVEPAEATAHEADNSLIVISPTNTISPSVMMSLVADHSTHCNHDDPTTDLSSNKDD